MAFHESTVSSLRQELVTLKNWRRNEESSLAGAETKVRSIKATIAEITERIADTEKLLAIVEPPVDVDPAIEAFVDVADAERTAQRDEYVNGAVPDFKPGDMVNVSEPGHKHFGVRGSIVGFVYDPDGVVVEYDNLGNTFTVPESSLMHYAEFVKQPQEYFDAAEAADVREIEREMAVEAGDDSEREAQIAEDDARFERSVWLANQAAKDAADAAESEA